MHTSFHAFSGVVVGELSLLALEPFLGLWVALGIAFAIAFWSHTEVDRLGEGNCYGTFERAILIDSIGMGGIITLSGYLLFGWTGVLFALAANIIDIIDKYRNHVMKLPSIFPSHKKGFKMLCSITPKETLAINALVTAISIIGVIIWIS